jgi:hypothetical protein
LSRFFAQCCQDASLLESGNGSKLDVATSKFITAEFLITISDFIVMDWPFSFTYSLKISDDGSSHPRCRAFSREKVEPGCAMRARGHRQTQARHEEDKQGVPHP